MDSLHQREKMSLFVLLFHNLISHGEPEKNFGHFTSSIFFFDQSIPENQPPFINFVKMSE